MRYILMAFCLFIGLQLAACSENKAYAPDAQGEMVFDGEKSPSEQYREQKEFEDRQREIYRTIR